MAERDEIMTRLHDALADLYHRNPPEFSGEVERALFYATGFPGWSVENERLSPKRGRLQAVPTLRRERDDG